GRNLQNSAVRLLPREAINGLDGSILSPVLVAWRWFHRAHSPQPSYLSRQRWAWTKCAHVPALLSKPGLRGMEQPADPLLGPAELRREGVIETFAQEDANFTQLPRKGRQGGGPLAFAEPLNAAALDNNVERAGTHRRVQQVANHKFHVPSRSLKHW